MNLTDAVDEFVTYRTGAGYAKNTAAASRQALQQFMAITGNIKLRSLDARHGEAYLSWMLGQGFKPRTINQRISIVRSFCKWARDRRLMGANQNPLATCREQKISDPPKRRVPVQDFGRLLDAADSPQTRIILALGLYLFLRSSEIVGLEVGHVDLDAGEIEVYQPKTKKWDVMPISAELDAELRRWLTWYTQDSGPLSPGWALVPPRKKRRIDLPVVGQSLNPTRRMSNTSLKVHEALRAIGWQVTGDHGEGVHTLRRSGARALYDELCERDDPMARDRALRTVQAMLHHASVTQTETYIGLEADRERRDTLFKGVQMFTTKAPTNVIPLSVAGGEGV